LVLAPHLEYPARNGGDILIDKKWSRLSVYVPFVDIIGKDTITRYEGGRLVKSVHYTNTHVSKTMAAFSTLAKRSHYLLEKNVTKSFMEKAQLYLAKPEYKTVVCSFIWTAAAVTDAPEIEGGLYCVETHNDEIEWFENLRRSSTNPLAKLTAYFSEKWAWSFLNKHGSDFVFFHVSKADQEGYLRRFPDHRSYVVPTGVDEVSRELPWQEDLVPSGKVRLLFVGALGVKINLDAIEFFKEDFYPLLKGGLGGDLEVLVVGSNPSDKVSRLCREMGWMLYPDVSDEELRRLYRTSTFSILPFRYTAGSKLKLLHSLANGVPYLATLALRDQIEEVVYPCLISGDPEEWLDHIQKVRRKGITNGDRAALMNHARKYSWASVARQTFQLLSHGAYSVGHKG
jgi:glycosyltransferase involved in cell wall biosynthesis